MSRSQRIEQIASLIESDEIIKLRHLRAEMQRLYPNDVDTLIINMKSYLIHKTPLVQEITPLFKDFYSTFLNILNASDIIPGSRKERDMVIKDMLGVIAPSVIKYDFHFSGTLIETLDVDIKKIKEFAYFNEFVFIAGSDKLVMWNTKTDQRTVYTFPNISSIGKHILYENGEFIVPVGVREAGIRYLGIGIFGSQGSQYYPFPNRFIISGMKLLDRSHVIVGGDRAGLHVVNIETLSEEPLIGIPKSSSLLVDNTQIISGGIRSIVLWNYFSATLITSINLPNQVVRKIQFLDNQILVTTNTHLLLIKERSIVNSIDVVALETNPSIFSRIAKFIQRSMVIPSRQEIIVHSLNRIFVFNYNLNLLRFSPVHRVTSLHLLPGDIQLITLNTDVLRVWDLQTFEVLHETSQIKGIHNIVIGSRLYNLAENQITIYE